MRLALPAPLVVRADTAREANERVMVADMKGNEAVRARAFGAILARSRSARGVLDGVLEIFAAEDPLEPPAFAGPGAMWVPHVFCWERLDQPALAWERCSAADAEQRIGGTVEQLARWAEQPQLLLALLRMATTDTRGGRTASTEGNSVPASGGAASISRRGEMGCAAPVGTHLSMRWITANEAQVAEWLSRGVVGVEHVSLHVAVEEEPRVARMLIEALGLIEISRPTSIRVPGRWLQAGAVRVHLNSRAVEAGEEGFPGTAPNHVCFAVADLDSAERAVRDAGFQTRRAGSLGQQVWFRLASGTAVELQPLRGDTS